MKRNGQSCVDNCYMKYIEGLSNTTVNTATQGAGMRQWLYQTCSQFGYCTFHTKNHFILVLWNWIFLSVYNTLDFNWNLRIKSLNFIYFTTITKQVIHVQLTLIMLVGTDVCVRMVFMWEETWVPGGNPPVWLGDHMRIWGFWNYIKFW